MVFCKPFASPNLKFSKTQLSKKIQQEGILCELLVVLPCTAFKARAQQLIKRAIQIFINKYKQIKSINTFMK